MARCGAGTSQRGRPGCCHTSSGVITQKAPARLERDLKGAANAVYYLTLRSKRDWLKFAQLSEGRVQCSDIQLGLEGKVVEPGGGPQQFEFDKRA